MNTEELINLKHLYLTHLRQAQTYGREVAKVPSRDTRFTTLVGVAQNAMGALLAHCKQSLKAEGWQALDDAAANQADYMRHMARLGPEAHRAMISLHEFIAENSHDPESMQCLIDACTEAAKKLKTA